MKVRVLLGNSLIILLLCCGFGFIISGLLYLTSPKCNNLTGPTNFTMISPCKYEYQIEYLNIILLYQPDTNCPNGNFEAMVNNCNLKNIVFVTLSECEKTQYYANMMTGFMIGIAPIFGIVLIIYLSDILCMKNCRNHDILAKEISCCSKRQTAEIPLFQPINSRSINTGPQIISLTPLMSEYSGIRETS